ncbi:MAG: DUF1587 domain-containing protein, partial [Lentisphaeraceae bacterium]|nr:DUF1587 domain-containing protein [Lentisphaeraceae bacterium]
MFKLHLLIMLSFLSNIKALETNYKKLDQGVHKFIQNYCLDCHNSDKQKGDRRFDELSILEGRNLFIDVNNHVRMTELTEILDVLNLGEMPPDKKNVEQPSSEERRNTVAWITNFLTEQSSKNTSQTVMRRLNHYQYLNSIRDLLSIDAKIYGATSLFPDDEVLHGFDNIGQSLNYSDILLNEQIKAAKLFLDKAIHFKQMPKAKTWTFSNKHIRSRTSIAMAGIHWRLKKDNYIDIAHGDPFAELLTAPSTRALNKGKGILEDGYYKIKINASAINRLSHPYTSQDIPTNLNQPMKLAVYSVKGYKGFRSSSAKLRTLLKVFELEDHQAKDFTTTVWLTKGDFIGFNWHNG